MKKEIIKITSSDQQLQLDTFIHIPDNPKAIIFFAHGMAEHKERYFPAIDILVNHGYGCIIHDHRGHGTSVLDKKDLGYFYDTTSRAIVEDLHCINQWIKKEYPALPIILLGHSMGTLVSRCYIHDYAGTIDGLILSGAPCANSASKVAITLASIITRFKGDTYRSPLLNNLSVGAYNKNFKNEGENAWLSRNKDNVITYNNNPLCGFTFTCNGFTNLFKLLYNTYNKNAYKKDNLSLPILFIAGKEDPVIGGVEAFHKQIQFINTLGYTNTSSILYDSFRHEILNEDVKLVTNDILSFIDNIKK